MAMKAVMVAALAAVQANAYYLPGMAPVLVIRLSVLVCASDRYSERAAAS